MDVAHSDTYEELDLEAAVEQAKSSQGISYVLTDRQKGAIYSVLKGNDTFVNLPTGYGKSMVYQLVPQCVDFMKLKQGHKESASVAVVISPLVSLMRDQVKTLRQRNVTAGYVTDVLKQPVEMALLRQGKLSIVFASPETLLGPLGRELLTSSVYQHNLCGIFVDEGHCVAKWGFKSGKLDAFRKSYSCIAEVRSLVPSTVPMTALTATASPEVKKTILQSLGMSNVNTIQVSPERTNIKYSVTSTLAKDPDSQFHWLFRDIQEHRKQTPKLIIFCQTHRQCRELHAAFEDNLGEDLIFHIAMYHSCTEEQRKEKVMEDFTKAGSFIRVLIATVAFGMGVHVEELYNVLHYGPARDVDDYFQETGRIGRDGKQSYATLLKFPGCFAACKVHERMKDYMETTQCRRQLLLNHYEVSVPSQVIQHLCCDNCSDKCDCSSDSCNADVTKGWLAKHLMRPSASTETPQHFHPQMRTVTDSQRVELQQKVEAYRDSLLQGQEDAMYSGIDMTSGISVSLISTIVQNCHLICSYEDLLKYPFFNDTDAKEIWNVITETLGTEFSSDIVCDTDSDSESDDSVEDEQSQHSSEDIVSRPVLSSNSSSSSD